MVTCDDPVAGFDPKVPVIPAGQAVAARVTGELKPPDPVMVTVDVELDPTLTVAALLLNLKLGDTAPADPNKIALITALTDVAEKVIVTAPLTFQTA
jgi:hypothetical protein